MATLYPKHLKHEWYPARKARALKRKYRYVNNYNEKNYRVYRAFFDRRTEQDIIDYLESHKPYKQAILEAIRYYIENVVLRSEKD